MVFLYRQTSGRILLTTNIRRILVSRLALGLVSAITEAIACFVWFYFMTFKNVMTTREFVGAIRLVAWFCVSVCEVWPLIFECLDLETSFSVTKYIFRIAIEKLTLQGHGFKVTAAKPWMRFFDQNVISFVILCFVFIFTISSKIAGTAVQTVLVWTFASRCRYCLDITYHIMSFIIFAKSTEAMAQNKYHSVFAIF